MHFTHFDGSLLVGLPVTPSPGHDQVTSRAQLDVAAEHFVELFQLRHMLLRSQVVGQKDGNRLVGQGRQTFAIPF